MEANGEPRQGVRRPLTLSAFIKFRRVVLTEQVYERHDRTSSTTCSLVKPR